MSFRFGCKLLVDFQIRRNLGTHARVSGCKTSGCHLLANACGVQSLAGHRQMGFSMDNGIRFPVSFFIILYFQEIVKKKTCFSAPIVIKYRENAKRKDIFA